MLCSSRLSSEGLVAAGAAMSTEGVLGAAVSGVSGVAVGAGLVGAGVDISATGAAGAVVSGGFGSSALAGATAACVLDCWSVHCDCQSCLAHSQVSTCSVFWAAPLLHAEEEG